MIWLVGSLVFGAAINARPTTHRPADTGSRRPSLTWPMCRGSPQSRPSHPFGPGKRHADLFDECKCMFIGLWYITVWASHNVWHCIWPHCPIPVTLYLTSLACHVWHCRCEFRRWWRHAITLHSNIWSHRPALCWLVVFNISSIARSFRDGTPIYCPLWRTWSSINTPFRPGIEPQAVAWQSITLPLRYASSTQLCVTLYLISLPIMCHTVFDLISLFLLWYCIWSPCPALVTYIVSDLNVQFYVTFYLISLFHYLWHCIWLHCPFVCDIIFYLIVQSVTFDHIVLLYLT